MVPEIEIASSNFPPSSKTARQLRRLPKTAPSPLSETGRPEEKLTDKYTKCSVINLHGSEVPTAGPTEI